MYRLRSGDRTLTLHPGEWAVGRLPTAGVFVNDSEVSRQHAIVRVTERAVELEDLKSRNGSFVNGVQIVGRFTLRPGDRLRFGSVEFVLESDEAEQARTGREFTPLNKVPGTYPGESRPPSVTQAPAPPPGSPTPVPAAPPGGGLPPGATPTLEMRRPPLPPPAPATPPARAAILICVGDRDWSERVSRAAGTEPNFNARVVGPKEVEAAAASSPPGCLLLDVDVVGKGTPKVLQAWWGPDRRRGPVLIVSAAPEHEGVVLARNLGAQAYVRIGRRADMVIAQMRYQIQRASAAAKL
ncbi:MAG TPA: FHA domain-containing protein [Myxococcota bacterium]|nr:FHA domain-containing protein [Myxococcota bacterium]